MARPKKTQAAEAGARGSTPTTASSGNSGNARRATPRRLTLTDRVRAMESNNNKLIRLADQIKQMGRGG